jgi:hypothetical protein
MATLGDKVTDTIVNALGKGIEGGAEKHKERLGELVKPRVEAFLADLPDNHPLHAQLASFESNTSFMDIVAWVIGFIPGIVQIIWALGDPYAEEGRQWANSSNPLKLAPPGQQALAAMRGYGAELRTAEGFDRLGYGPRQQQVFHAASRQLLDPGEVRDASLRGISFGTSADDYLTKFGYTAAEISTLKQLWNRLPSVQDLVRMAVREVWTPEISSKFGQYADFPPEFAAQAAKVGLSSEVAQWYWAAHWELPSVNMGFEMMHRGVIDQGTMEMLLRAQDVMPYWRDKITAIAYSPLTRVDVRRMYQLGVLDEPGVIKAYKELGYNAENSQRMLEFTKVYYGPEDETGEEADRDWTKAEILDGYRKKIISADQAKMALQEMSYNAAKIDFFLAREDLKAVQTRKEAYIDRWHSLYIEGIATADEVSNSLVDVGVTKAEVDELLPLWYLERIQRVAKPTRAELNRFLKKGIITEVAWNQQMQLMGYSDQYIEWYLADARAA